MRLTLRRRQREPTEIEIETETEQHATVFEYCGCVSSLTKTPAHPPQNIGQETVPEAETDIEIETDIEPETERQRQKQRQRQSLRLRMIRIPIFSRKVLTFFTPPIFSILTKKFTPPPGE